MVEMPEKNLVGRNYSPRKLRVLRMICEKYASKPPCNEERKAVQLRNRVYELPNVEEHISSPFCFTSFRF
jgi:hypothetical protein